MIESRKMLKEYLACDKAALGMSGKRVLPWNGCILRFERLLRKCEYYENCSKNCFTRLYASFLKIKFKKLSLKLGFTIPLNVFGPGLCIVHYGTIVVSSSARVGRNCRIHECTNIGATNGSSKAPIIGDNVFIGTGAKIIGDIKIGDNVCVGAGAVVVKSFPSNITVGGVPASKISDNDSSSNNPKLDI